MSAEALHYGSMNHAVLPTACDPVISGAQAPVQEARLLATKATGRTLYHTQENLLKSVDTCRIERFESG